jgi:hypothetical protein
MGKLPRGNRSPCCRQRDGRIQVATVPCESIYASSHETQFANLGRSTGDSAGHSKVRFTQLSDCLSPISCESDSVVPFFPNDG